MTMNLVDQQCGSDYSDKTEDRRDYEPDWRTNVTTAHGYTDALKTAFKFEHESLRGGEQGWHVMSRVCGRFRSV